MTKIVNLKLRKVYFYPKLIVMSNKFPLHISYLAHPKLVGTLLVEIKFNIDQIGVIFLLAFRSATKLQSISVYSVTHSLDYMP